MITKQHSARVLGSMLGLTVLVCTVPVSKAAGPETKPDHTVVLTNIEFKPNRVKVKKGETIRFINRDKFDHDVYLVRTANRNDVIHAATTIHSGQSVDVKIDQEGLFTLYCTIHGGMTGKITTTNTFELTEEEKKRAASRKVIPPIVKVGEELYWGRAQCHHCHMMGDRGTNIRGPNHQDLGFRAAARAQKLGLSSATEYIVQSILEPSAHIVEGYSDDMPKVYQPPINLNKEDIKALVAYLQSQGGEVDTWSIDINPQIISTKLEPSPFRHGDPKRGRLVFQEMGCRSCHTVGEEKAISVAPELTAIGAYRNWTWLVQAVSDPNAEIGANWHDATVYLKPGVKRPGGAFDKQFLEDEEFSEDEDAQPEQQTDHVDHELAQARAEMERIREQIRQLEKRHAALNGDEADQLSQASKPTSVATVGVKATPDQGAQPDEKFEYSAAIPGVLRKDSAEEVTLLIADNRFETFPRDQIARLVLSKKSRMATNYGELMTFQQMADLVSYLESLKGPPPKTPGQASSSLHK